MYSSGCVPKNIINYTDYYPFGMEMPNRSGSVENYRYGFNGIEKDDEVKGYSNSLDFGARIYDSRLGKWLSVDALQAKYPFASSYNFVLNTPIQAYDPDGRLVIFVNGYRPSAPGANIYREIKRKHEVFKTDKYNYWGEIDDQFKKAIRDDNAVYADGDAPTLTARSNFGFNARKQAGRIAGKDLIAKIKSGEIVLEKNDAGEVIETIKVVTHSMGYAYS